MNSLQKQSAAFKARRAAQPIFKRPIINRNAQNNSNTEANKLHNKIFEARRLKNKACNIYIINLSFLFIYFVLFHC